LLVCFFFSSSCSNNLQFFSFVCNLVPWGIVGASATFGQSCTA
jgi:hypothetical protein